MNILKNHVKNHNDPTYEFCPRCEANLTLQKGYSNELTHWNCRGCGELLINPQIDIDEGEIFWICDECGCLLNIQEDFSTSLAEWKCTECGCHNKIERSEIYYSEDEYQTSLLDPYKGLSNEEVLDIFSYEEISFIKDRPDVILVKNQEDEKLYVKKYIKNYDLSVFQYLKENPVEGMPKILSVYEGSNNLVVIEEYIDGKTLSEIIDDGCIEYQKALILAKQICLVLKRLHSLPTPIVHRDIKPSNIIVLKDGRVCLLDINASKWYKSGESEDTRLLGTLHYAAPEQLGYGFSASSEKTDVYAVGVLLNVMLTGKMPKETKPEGDVWNVIERCIHLSPDDRFSIDELLLALEKITI